MVAISVVIGLHFEVASLFRVHRSQSKFETAKFRPVAKYMVAKPRPCCTYCTRLQCSQAVRSINGQFESAVALALLLEFRLVTKKYAPEYPT